MQPDRIIRLPYGAPKGTAPRIEDDPWHYAGLDGDAGRLPEGPVVASLGLWRERRDALLARGAPLGVWLGPADDPQALAGDLARLALVGVHFPRFADGRGFSIAVTLRLRLRYRGELRAFGDVGRDQLFYLKRCGFDAFRLAPHRDPEAALAAFEDFGRPYQGAVDDPVPLFRRRLATGAP